MPASSRRTFAIAAVMLLALTPLGAAPAGVDLRLADAAKSRDWAAVNGMIRRGADVNAPQPDGATALHWASHWSDAASVRALLSAGAKANAANDFGITPLWLACTNANDEVVRLLLDGGADANLRRPTGETALMTCSRTGNAAAVSALLKHGAQVDDAEPAHHQTALMWASAQNHPDVAAALIAAGAKVDARTDTQKALVVAGIRRAGAESVGFSPILFAARTGAREAIDVLLAHGANISDTAADGSSVLQTAMAMGKWELVPYLLEHGANPNAADAGYTALQWAAGSWEALLSGVVGADSYRWMAARGPGKLDLIKVLLDHGADPNARVTKMPPLFGNFGSSFHLAGGTAFVLAGTSGDVKVMRALVEHGADPKATSKDGTTALMTAAGLGQTLGISSISADEALEAVKFALAQGIDINAVNDEGETALHGAAYFGADPVVQYLVDHGAAINARNGLGLTPMTVAQGYGGGGGILINKSTVALLGKLGGVGDVDMPWTAVANVRSGCPAPVVDFELSNPGYGKVYVTTTPKTQFLKGTCADIWEGAWIHVTGVRETDSDKSWDGSVIASSIEIAK